MLAFLKYPVSRNNISGDRLLHVQCYLIAYTRSHYNSDIRSVYSLVLTCSCERLFLKRRFFAA